MKKHLHENSKNLDISELIDLPDIKVLMENFYQITQIPMAIIDTKGKVFVGAGWQDICIKFHRVHPVTCRHCIESDIKVSAKTVPGKFTLYKCKNGMWDMATPIIVEDQYIGNIFIGQFFFNDEPLNFEFFWKQASKYGFDESEYFSALQAVPRVSRDQLEKAEAFFLSFANSISWLSYNNLKLSQTIRDFRQVEKHLEHRSFLLGNVTDAVISSNGDFVIDFWNKGAERMYGWSEEEVIGKNGPELLRSKFIGISLEEAADKAIENDGFRAEVVQYHKNGKPLTIETFFKVITDTDGKISHYVSVNRDVTERKISEDKILEAKNILEQNVYDRTLELSKSLSDLAIEKERFRHVLDLLPVYVILLAPDHKIVFTNRVFNNLFGPSTGKICYEQLFGRDSPCENCESYTVLKTGKPNFWEWTGPNGSIYSVSDFPYTDSEGSRLILEMGEDITHKKSIEKFVMKRVIETEEADRSRFASDLHDDLGPVLSTIKMQLDILKNHPADSKQLATLNQCGELLSESIEKIRDIANNLTPRLIEKFGLETAVNSFIKKIPKSGKISVTLKSNLKGTRFLQGTEIHLYRIICELINNTLKHSGATEAHIELDLKDGFLTMTYMDNGIGYTVEKQDDKKGVGLYNIIQRVRFFDGQIDFLDKQGKVQVIIQKKVVPA